MIGEGKLAYMDDQYCQSIGAKPKSDTYVQCRMMRTAQREESHQRAYQRAAGFGAYGAASMQQNATTYRPTNCTYTPVSTWVGGPVRQVNTACY